MEEKEKQVTTLEEEKAVESCKLEPSQAKTKQFKAKPTSGSAKAKFPRPRTFSHESTERLKQLEKGFILDGTVVSTLYNNETGRTQPSLNFGIPQYNAVNDRYCASYLKSKQVPKLNEESRGSMMGSVFDKFVHSSKAGDYLKERKSIGAGYTQKMYGGHTSVPTDPSKDGYHGKDGFRRNTPDLRRRRSVFDYEEPFENPRPLQPVPHRPRTLSAPASIRLMRQKSASTYRTHPGGGPMGVVSPRKVQSAMPRASLLPPLKQTRQLATGPIY